MFTFKSRKQALYIFYITNKVQTNREGHSWVLMPGKKKIV